MCFSAQASFIIATGLTILGSLAIYKAKTTSLKLMASTILFFALQQAFEGIVWISLTHTMPPIIGTISTYGFLFFAMLFWPTWLPAIFYHQEQHNPSKRKQLIALFACGAFFALCSLIALSIYGATAQIIGHHISYDIPLPYTLHTIQSLYYFGMTLYLFATIMTLCISGLHLIRVMGIMAMLGFIISYFAYWLTVGSVWCFFAAIISSLIYIVVCQENKRISYR